MSHARNHGIADSADLAAAPGPTHQRILQVLGMTLRPLGSSEIEGALGMLASDARTACRWLTDNGYIKSSTRVANASAVAFHQDLSIPSERAAPFWSLADKGRAWVKRSMSGPVTAQ